MENQLVQNKGYDIGVEIIDKEHKKLFRILNKLIDFGKQDMKSQWVCQKQQSIQKIRQIIFSVYVLVG